MLGLQNFAGTNRVCRHGHRAGRLWAGKKSAPSFNAWANRQSPNNTAISLPQWAASVGWSRRISASSITSSCTSVARWTISMMTAAVTWASMTVAKRAGGQGHDGGAVTFPAAARPYWRRGRSAGIKIVDLPDQLLGDRLEKRLHRFHDLFPGTIRIGIRISQWQPAYMRCEVGFGPARATHSLRQYDMRYRTCRRGHKGCGGACSPRELYTSTSRVLSTSKGVRAILS